jgi:transposase-like protein
MLECAGIVAGTVGACCRAEGMTLVPYSRHQFPPLVIQHAVWLYLRFTLSYPTTTTPSERRNHSAAMRRVV